MEPYYDHDGVQIFLGDCRDILPTLGRFDLMLTDVPYGKVNRESGGLRSLDKGDADVVTVHPAVVARFASQMTDCVYVWCGTEQISEYRAELVKLGMTTRLCIWEKTNPSPMNGEHLWLSSLETCVFGRRKGAIFNRHCESPVWRGPVATNQKHPTQKPTWLMRKLIAASTLHGDTVIDPMMGSGTSLFAAKMEGRKAVGIELKEAYAEIAANRLRQGVLF